VFGVIVARERETDRGDDISAVEGIGATRPLLAWPLTIGMLALAGLPGTAGFMGKLYLIEATVEADYTWLGVAIVIGTMVSLAYYLRVIAAIWMRPEPAALPAIAGAAEGAGEADDAPWQPSPPSQPELGYRARAAAASPAPATTTRGTGRCVLIWGPTVLCAVATVAFGVYPSPLIDWAANSGVSIFPG
jgi:NADH-quinone oxidoreductase subunit N